MQNKEPDNVKYLQKWQKEYGFNGKLVVEECEKLVGKIEAETGNNKTKQRKAGMLQAQQWLNEAQNRKRGIQQNKEKKERENREAEDKAAQPEDLEETNCRNTTLTYPSLPAFYCCEQKTEDDLGPCTTSPIPEQPEPEPADAGAHRTSRGATANTTSTASARVFAPASSSLLHVPPGPLLSRAVGSQLRGGPAHNPQR